MTKVGLAIGLFVLGQAGCAGGEPGQSTTMPIDAEAEHQVDAASDEANKDAADGSKGTSGKGAGTTIYRRNTILSVPGAGPGMTLAVQVLGLSNVELLVEDASGTIVARTIEPPPEASGATRIPVGIVIADVDTDGVDDLLVMDTDAGNWFAPGMDGTSPSHSTSGLALSALQATPNIQTLDTASGRTLVAGYERWFATMQLLDRHWSQPIHRVVPGSLNVRVSPQFFSVAATATSEQDLFHLGSGQLVRYGLAASAPAQPVSMVQASIVAPYLRRFDSFDHIQELPTAACPTSAIGIGLFQGPAGRVPRQVQQLVFSDVTFEARDVPVPYDVVTMASLPSGPQSSLVGMIAREGSGFVFAVYRVDTCDAWSLVAATPTDFDWRAPPAPGFGDNGPNVPKTDGVELLAVQSRAPHGEDSQQFLHYDGYDLRCWEVNLGANVPPRIEYRRVQLHKERTDNAF